MNEWTKAGVGHTQEERCVNALQSEILGELGDAPFEAANYLCPCAPPVLLVFAQSVIRSFFVGSRCLLEFLLLKMVNRLALTVSTCSHQHVADV